jgi:hypothetical protein
MLGDVDYLLRIPVRNCRIVYIGGKTENKTFAIRKKKRGVNPSLVSCVLFVNT